MLADTRAMGEVLAAKEIPAIVDIWGFDVNHDWPWWQKMLPYELERMGA
jgi:esterase/lipase superfamily enzyme